MLRSRKSRGEVPLGAYVPAPIVSRGDRIDPEHEALLAESVGLALLAIVGRSPTAARQLASRARRRVKCAAVPDADLNRQQEVVNTWMSASA